MNRFVECRESLQLLSFLSSERECGSHFVVVETEMGCSRLLPWRPFTSDKTCLEVAEIEFTEALEEKYRHDEDLKWEIGAIFNGLRV